MEEILRKHAEKYVAEMDAGFKRLWFPNMSNKRILKDRVRYYRERASLQDDDTVMITQNYGYYIIDKEGNCVDGICTAD